MAPANPVIIFIGFLPAVAVGVDDNNQRINKSGRGVGNVGLTLCKNFNYIMGATKLSCRILKAAEEHSFPDLRK